MEIRRPSSESGECKARKRLWPRVASLGPLVMRRDRIQRNAYDTPPVVHARGVSSRRERFSRSQLRAGSALVHSTHARTPLRQLTLRHDAAAAGVWRTEDGGRSLVLKGDVLGLRHLADVGESKCTAIRGRYGIFSLSVRVTFARWIEFRLPPIAGSPDKWLLSTKAAEHNAAGITGSGLL
ncbi:hypothetical protein BAUCODRAFT_197011 [Baudoinia panamericana UAMH 10762]|uniref:Uncharacterized protein n=1 Tax=Baudoinia panamericana (strain UAMH 10762) TaxID=717646 RepID=M2NA78_BAUPA|nr:uncharacterized protein BAUCODRAFT_197011 [Baudoinia panamericana UAMH 10762]EMD01124.1 hypothetical protein BAUCODRAFT_197011 [Baudoinia panamericana UAMH 10762]